MRYILHCFTLLFLVVLHGASIAQKTNASEPRLMKELRRVYNSSGYFSAFDSSMYAYSGDRAWDTIKNDWKYDMLTSGESRIVRDFDAQNRIVIEQYQKFDLGFWWPDKRMLFEYQNNKVSKMTYQEWTSGSWENLVQYEYSYDATGNKVVDLTMVWEPTGWRNSSRQVATYSANGAEEILHEKWVLTQNAWEAIASEHFIYTNGKKTERLFKLAQTGWDIYQHDMFTYNSKGNDSFTVSAVADGNNSFDTTRTIFHYNGSNKQDTIIQQMIVNGADSNMFKTLQIYTPYGLIGLRRTQTWDDMAKRWYYKEGSMEHLYFYELFNVGINSFAERDNSLELYPVPATGNNLTAVFWSAGTQILQVDIHSVDGKLARTQTIAVEQGRNKLNLSSAGLNPGNYVLTIGYGANRVSRLFIIEN